MTRYLHRLHSEQRGLTLVEMLMVVLVLGVVGAVAATGMTQALQTSRFSQERGDALQTTLVGVERISREVRAADPLRSTQPDEVTVDVRRDGSLHHYRYRVQAIGAGWELRQELWRFDDPALFDDAGFVPSMGTADTVSDSVLIRDLAASGVFEFLDGAGDPTNVPSQVRAVRIVIERMVNDEAEPIIIETTVRVRNA